MRPRSIEPSRSSCKPCSGSTARGSSSSSTRRRARALVSADPGGRFGAAAALVVPVGSHGRPRAPAVALLSDGPREFTPADIDLADTLANQAATALAVLRMRERLSRRADRQAALARAAGALNARLELRAVLDTLCREADQALGADVSGVYLGNAEGGVARGRPRRPGRLRLVGLHDPRRRGRRAGRCLPAGEPVVTNGYRQRGADPGHRCACGAWRRSRADALGRRAEGRAVGRLLHDAAR